MMSWQYDEMRQVGVDFEDAAEVEAYERNQGADPAEERRLIARLEIEAGHTVVDLGCGTGSFAREAARAGARVRAVDVSSAMLDFVARRAARDGIEGIACEHAGFLTFDAPPRSLDRVVTRFALHHLPDFWKQVALERLAKAIKPDGLLYLRDVVFSFPPDDCDKAIPEWIERMSKASGFSRDDFETHVREEHSTYAWVLEGMLERAGFEFVEKNHPSVEYAEYICRPRVQGDATRRES